MCCHSEHKHHLSPQVCFKEIRHGCQCGYLLSQGAILSTSECIIPLAVGPWTNKRRSFPVTSCHSVARDTRHRPRGDRPPTLTKKKHAAAVDSPIRADGTNAAAIAATRQAIRRVRRAIVLFFLLWLPTSNSPVSSGRRSDEGQTALTTDAPPHGQIVTKWLQRYSKSCHDVHVTSV